MGLDAKQSVKQKRIEDAIQTELVKWLDNNYPQIEYYYNKAEGIKTKATAMKDKRMGLKAGRVDMTNYLDARELTYILELELKKIDGDLQPSQKEWHKKFKPTKNRTAAIAYGLIEAQKIIEEWVKKVIDN